MTDSGSPRTPNRAPRTSRRAPEEPAQRTGRGHRTLPRSVISVIVAGLLAGLAIVYFVLIRGRRNDMHDRGIA